MRSESRMWIDSERDILGLILEKERYGWYASFLVAATWKLVEGEDLGEIAWQLLGFPLTFFVFHSLTSPATTRYRLLILSLYFELIQVSVYSAAVRNPDQAVWLSFSSTVSLICNQLTPLLPRELNIALIVKHVAVWHYILFKGAGGEKITLMTVISAGWTFFHMLTYLQARIQVLKSQFITFTSLRRKEEHIAALYNSLPNGILVITEDGVVVSYNKVLLDFLHLKVQSDQTEKTIYETLAKLQLLPEYRTEGRDCLLTDNILEYIKSSRSGFQSLGVVFLHEQYLEWRANTFEWEQQKACIICCRDITRWIALENLAKRESDSKSALVRSVSHELRTPTNAIINIVEDIKEKELLSQESSQDLSMLTSSAQFLLSVINDLLDYSSLVSGRFGLTKGWFQLKPTMKECVDLIELQCKHKHLDLVLRFDPTLPGEIFSDKNRIKQVILNLLSNALKFTLSGRIEVVALSISEYHAGVRVVDTGIGIEEDKLGKIFTLFGKLEGNDRLNPQGCGLGLGISNMLVHSLGGAGIHVSSKRFCGSVFGFEFNISQEDVTEPAFDSNCPTNAEMHDTWEGVEPITPPVHVATGSELSPVDVLIADDVDYNRIVLRRILEAAGYQCDEAGTGLLVLQRLREHSDSGKAIPLVLMDVEMPEMDGVAATREIRRMAGRGELPNPPVIIGCSAYSSAEDREMCFRAGMQHYIEKPVNRDVLTSLVASILSRRLLRRTTTV